MPQYLNARMYEGLRKVTMDGKDMDGTEGKQQHKVNQMPTMAQPNAFMHPTFFYHPGIIINPHLKMPTTNQEHPPTEGEKKM